MNAFPRVDSSFSFSLCSVSRTYSTLFLSLSPSPFPFIISFSPVFQSPSVSFFILLDATFALVPRAWWLLPFFFLPSQPRTARIFVLFYFRRFHFSFPFDAYAALCPFRVVRAVASFIVFVPRCPLRSRVAAVAPIPLQVFHARKRVFSYFSRLPLSRVRPAIARSRSRDPLRDIFRFPFRYVRSVSDTWSVLPCLDIVLFYRVKCILQASPVFAPFFLFYRVYSAPLLPLLLKFLTLRYFADGRSSKIRYARFPPITRVNSGTQLESGEPQDRRTRQTAMAAARWSANPQSNNIQLNFCKFAVLAEMAGSLLWEFGVLCDSLNCVWNQRTASMHMEVLTDYITRALLRLLTWCISTSHFITAICISRFYLVQSFHAIKYDRPDFISTI